MGRGFLFAVAVVGDALFGWIIGTSLPAIMLVWRTCSVAALDKVISFLRLVCLSVVRVCFAFLLVKSH